MTKTMVKQKKLAYKEARELYWAEKLAKNAKFCLKEPYMVFCKVVCFLELILVQPLLYRSSDYVDITISHAIGILSLVIVLARGRALVNLGLVDKLPETNKRKNEKINGDTSFS